MARGGHHDWSPSQVGPSAASYDSTGQEGRCSADVLPPASHVGELHGSTQYKLGKRNLLALDGGGVRGHWTLLLLQDLMQKIGRVEEEDDEMTGLSDVYTSFHPHGLDKNCTHIGVVRINDRSSLEGAEHTLGESGKVVEARRIPKEQRYLPCHYFDYIGGSSTGALIAIMLGRLRMPVRDCLEEYKNLAARVFGHPNHIYEMRFPLPFISRTKFNERGLVEAVNDVVNRRRPENDGEQTNLSFPLDEDLCKTFVTTLEATAQGRAVSLLRSYSHYERSRSQQPAPLNTRIVPSSSAPRNRRTDLSEQSVPTSFASRSFVGPQRSETGFTTRSERTRRSKTTNLPPKRQINYGPATHWEVVRIARAATAAELYFPPVKDDKESKKYYDGGFSDCNNPTLQGIEDIRERWGKQSVGVVVSVGTARHDSLSQSKRWRFRGRVREWTDRMTDPKSIHRRVKSESNDDRFAFPYFRFTAKRDFALNISLDEWKPRQQTFPLKSKISPGHRTIDEIDRQFNRWLIQQPVQDNLNKCAKQLVAARRHRMEKGAEWERFAIGATYKCNVGECGSMRDFLSRDEFLDHLVEQHPDTMQEAAERNPHLDEKDLAQRVLRERRKHWIYRPRTN